MPNQEGARLQEASDALVAKCAIARSLEGSNYITYPYSLDGVTGRYGLACYTRTL